MGELLYAISRLAWRAGLVFAGVTIAFALWSCTRGGAPPKLRTSSADDGSRPPLPVPLLRAPPTIRVRLTAATDTREVTLSVEGAYVIRDAVGSRVLLSGEQLEATRLIARDGKCVLGSWPPLEPVVECVPGRDGSLRVGEVRYRGTVRCSAIGDRLTLVNCLDLEQYLAGVLGSEAPLDWPDAALEAQAVAARSYALWQMRSAMQRGGTEADVADDVSSQVYLGMKNETDRSRAIVAATRGAICVFNGTLFPTFYSNTCGGHTEPARLVLPRDTPPDIPPLMGRPCAYCELSPNFGWKADFTRAEMAGMLAQGGNVRGDEVATLRIVEAGPGGHAVRVGVTTKSNPTERVVTSLDFRLALGARRLKSTLFRIEPTATGIRFAGNGWGHAAGMCQMGMHRMAKEGFDSLAILEYYYPAAEVVRLYD